MINKIKYLNVLYFILLQKLLYLIMNIKASISQRFIFKWCDNVFFCVNRYLIIRPFKYSCPNENLNNSETIRTRSFLLITYQTSIYLVFCPIISCLVKWPKVYNFWTNAKSVVEFYAIKEHCKTVMFIFRIEIFPICRIFTFKEVLLPF